MKDVALISMPGFWESHFMIKQEHLLLEVENTQRIKILWFVLYVYTIIFRWLFGTIQAMLE